MGNRKSGEYIGAGLALGIALGLMMDNLGAGIAIGVALGAAMSGLGTRMLRENEPEVAQRECDSGHYKTGTGNS